jgi:cyclophilin family peptidyl-prolyl cis-trans isomerase
MRSSLLLPLLCTLVTGLSTAELRGQGQKPAKNAKQQGKQEPAAAATPPAPKDDAVTLKDPAIAAIDKFRKAQVSTKRADWKTTLPAPPRQTFSSKHNYDWHVVTSHGKLVIRLLPEAAPMHVTSVIFLARSGFYDGLQFPRILKGFMAQGGSPLNTQTGNAGYTMDGEFLTGQKHDQPGMLSAANSGQPNTDGSQFFLTFVPTPHLDGKHTVHGITVEGLEVLKAIEACGTERDGQPLACTVTMLRTWITVAEKPPTPPAEGKPEASSPTGEKPPGGKPPSEKPAGAK